MSYRIGDVTFEVISHKDREAGPHVIDDIIVELTPEEYKTLLSRLHDPHASAKNAPYPYLFQNALNKYNEYASLELAEIETQYHDMADKASVKAKDCLKQAYKIQQMKALMNNLREFSQPFVTLEQWINDPGYDPKQTLATFESQFKIFQGNLELQKNELLDKYQDNAEISHLIRNRLFPRLEDNINTFTQQFELLRHQGDHLTPQQVRHLLSINRRGPTITPLGLFMGESLISTLDTGIKAAKEIHGSRLTEQLGALHGSSELTHAKLEMEIKLSTEGTGHVDTYSKTDEQLIQHHMLSQSTLEATPINGHIKVSLRYYCPNLTSSEIIRVAEVVKSVRRSGTTSASTEAVIKTKTETRPLSMSIAIGVWVIAAGLMEAGFATAHFALNIVLVIPALLLPKTMQSIDQGLSQLHHYFSINIGLKRARQRWNERYLFGKEQDLKGLVEECTQPYSYFHEILATGLSVASMTHFVTTSAVSIASNLVVAPYRFFRYALVETTPEKTFNDVNALHDKDTQYVQLLKEITTIMERKPVELMNNPKLNVINQLQIPTAFITEIIIGGSNLLVTPIFRNSPGVATVFFAISIGGFVCFLPPVAAVACLKGLIKIFTAPLNFIGMQLMGSLPTTLMNQAVSGLFLWKVGVLSTEAMIEMYEGHYDFLTTLIENPEKLILGLTSVLALGYGLRFLPLLPVMITLPNGFQVPNLYAIIINIYIYQAKEGSLTANLASIDYLLLGLQTAILLQTVVNVDAINYPIQNIKEEFEKAEILKIVDEHQLREKINHICKICHVTFPPHVIDGIIAKIESLQHDPKASETLLEVIKSSQPVFEHADQDNANNTAILARIEEEASAAAEVILEDGPQKKTPFDELEHLYEQILSACERMEHNLSFADTPQSSAKNQAMRYYDHLDALINKFNQLAQEQNDNLPSNKGRAQMSDEDGSNHSAILKTAIPFIDKRPLLAVFYRRHCMSTRTMVGRYAAIFPLAPITYSARLISAIYGWSFNKPSWVKSAAIATSDDILMITDFMFAMVRATWAFALYVGGLLRMPIAALILPAKAGEAIDHARFGTTDNLDDSVFKDNYIPDKIAPDKRKRTFLDKLYGAANSISPHRAYDAAKRMPYIGPVVTYVGGGISAVHANAARSVSTNDDIEGAARALNIHLKSIAVNQKWPTLLSTATIIKKKGRVSPTSSDAACSKEPVFVVDPPDNSDKQILAELESTREDVSKIAEQHSGTNGTKIGRF